MSHKKLPFALGFLLFILLASWSFPVMAEQSAQDEKDEIFMLTAYSVVLNDWQQSSPHKRGHNIGSILVDDKGQIVWWARNCNAILNNGTQHGEIRLIVGYLNHTPNRSTLDGYTIYTSLEPCAQCSGMMALTKTARTVYGQTDPAYGKAIERLALDSKKWNKAGYTPYPRADKLISDRSKTEFCTQLEEAYEKAHMPITAFLLTDEAKNIYQAAASKLQNYKIKYLENKKVLDSAKEFLKTRVYPGVPPIIIKAEAKPGMSIPKEMKAPQSSMGKAANN